MKDDVYVHAVNVSIPICLSRNLAHCRLHQKPEDTFRWQKGPPIKWFFYFILVSEQKEFIMWLLKQEEKRSWITTALY